MPFAINSPERRARVITDEGKLVSGKTVEYMSLHDPFRYQERDDNLTYTARRGDRLEHIATVFYRDPQLFWVLADFQPNPILNPLLPLEPGRVIYGPSVEVLEREILNL
jgi:hypothetical protein